MNITVLGAGAIGTLWAFYLKQAGHHIELQTRSQDEQVLLRSVDNAPAVSFQANRTSFLAETDLVLVTVKAGQVKTAIDSIADKLHPDTILLFMHNGMGSIDEVYSRLSAHPVVLATTTHGALKQSPEKVLHTGEGITLLGGYNSKGKQCQFLADVLNSALPEVQWDKDINKVLWNKLAVNCAINPLTALYQCKNGELASDSYKAELIQIIEEVTQVMQAEQIDVEFSILFNKVMDVINATAENFSSMHQDIYYQRPSEIDYITGYLCRKAEQHQIAVPANSTLYKKIRQLENHQDNL
ncbi:2-dehydropantoate 2-reductase [Vibrio sp. SCSIO 43137]|uniref:2-dehydropantoate 2-reductase n=1 Tax=Vibrio sp. SCSIO 43137 TaxID=3021011 RepID=UPI00230834D4|nr:2-dehydropantoate 2-reductase [Vibrio sp. SCSIO 43137]WCE29081.1 2-dehydropantoate 2-reductase [Vibrio sp. SCSIO 43137]